MMRSCLLAIVLACVATHVASAQSRVIVRAFDGGDKRVRETVVQAVAEADGLEMVPNKEADGTARSLGADLNTDAGRLAVARAMTVSAFVEGDVQRHGTTTDVNLRVYDGRDGALLTTVGIHASSAAVYAEVDRRVHAELIGAVRRGQPPSPPEPLPPPVAPAKTEPAKAEPAAAPAQPAPEPKPAAEPKPAPRAEEPKPEPDNKDSKPKQYALELGAGLVALSRSYVYRDELLKLPEHTGAATPALRLDARWYPATHLTKGVLANLGIEANAQVMWPSDAKRDNTEFTTTSTEFGIAARGRIPLGEHEIALVVGYGGQTYTFDENNGIEPGIPDVAYNFVRFGADARLQLHKLVQLELRADYLLLTGFGELGEREWFPHVSGGGVDAELYLGFDVSESIQLIVSGGVSRYFLSLNPEPSDAGIDQGRIAGGVTDQYVHGLFGIRLRPY